MEAPMADHNFLPVVGLRLHAKVPPPPLSQAQLILLCGLYQRKEQSEPFCTEEVHTLVSRITILSEA